MRVKAVVHQVAGGCIGRGRREGHGTPVRTSRAQLDDEVAELFVNPVFSDHEPFGTVENAIPLGRVRQQPEQGRDAPPVWGGIPRECRFEGGDGVRHLHLGRPIHFLGGFVGHIRGNGSRAGGGWGRGNAGVLDQPCHSCDLVDPIGENGCVQLAHHRIGPHGFNEPTSKVDAVPLLSRPLVVADQADRRHEAAGTRRPDDVPPVLVGIVLVVHDQHAVPTSHGYLIITDRGNPVRDRTPPLHAVVDGRATPLATNVHVRWR